MSYLGTKTPRFKYFNLLEDYLRRYNFTWRGGLNSYRYDEYKEKTCIFLHEGDREVYYGDDNNPDIYLTITQFMRYVKKETPPMNQYTELYIYVPSLKYWKLILELLFKYNYVWPMTYKDVNMQRFNEYKEVYLFAQLDSKNVAYGNASFLDDSEKKVDISQLIRILKNIQQ